MPYLLPNLLYKSYEQWLINTIKKASLPSHIAIIMDGNRRFAKKMGKMTAYGHRRGAEITENVIEWSYEIGIRELTMYAFSTENFNRRKSETCSIFELIRVKLEKLSTDERTHRRKLKVRVIGDRSQLPEDLLAAVRKIEKITSGYNEFTLNIAIAYGGRQDMVQAVRKIARKVRKGKFVPSEINETTISQHLYPEKDAPVSDVDLIIRTGGDERMSNFLPWQASGNECATYFCAPYWPDFRRVDFLRSVRLYQQHAAEKEKSFSERAYHLLKETGNKEISPKHTAVSVLHE